MRLPTGAHAASQHPQQHIALMALFAGTLQYVSCYEIDLDTSLYDMESNVLGFSLPSC